MSINCIPEPAFPALLPHWMMFIQGSGWEQLLFIIIARPVSFLWPTPKFDTLCTWPCPISSGTLLPMPLLHIWEGFVSSCSYIVNMIHMYVCLPSNLLRCKFVTSSNNMHDQVHECCCYDCSYVMQWLPHDRSRLLVYRDVSCCLLSILSDPYYQVCTDKSSCISYRVTGWSIIPFLI